ncbi:MAG: hypothetical protein ACD_41C00317G0011 [uncultured bacterium]|nr:MAG: hypothetical protein ACD_41C00317G0011 [uncultured bacterium]
MKTTNTASFHFVNICLTVVTILLVAIAGLTFYLALQGDTTLLGDPYYEDQILAPDRAFAPWALMMIASGLVVLAKVMSLWRKS